MIRLAHSSSNPNLIFTEDFHQFVRGRLTRGVPCTISYDPDRIVPDDDPYEFGDVNRVVRAYIRTRSDGPALALDLHSWSGQMQFAPTTATAQGPTLHGTFFIPDDAEWITVWFAFVNHRGTIEYDSNYGKNFVFRFFSEELVFDEVSVLEVAGNAMDRLVCQLHTPETIDSLQIRYRILNASDPQVRTVVPFECRRTESGIRYWELPDTWVPHDAVVQFDLDFVLEGERMKDDNQGRYYFAAWPEKMAAVQQTLHG